jgi:hypothetical protein
MQQHEQTEPQRDRTHHQPAASRNRIERPAELDRAWRSKSAKRRPVCAACHQVAPGPDRPRDDWLCAWGHRDQHGEPCRGLIMLPDDYLAHMARIRAAEPPEPATEAQLRLFAVPPAAKPAKRKRAQRVTWRQASAQYEQVRMF